MAVGVSFPPFLIYKLFNINHYGNIYNIAENSETV